MFKSNQTGHGVYHGYLECKRIFGVACLGKKLGFHTEICDYFHGNIDLFAYSIFKNIEILSGQGVVQLEPNWDRVYHGYLESETK